MPTILDTSIEYLKGVGTVKADMLKKELGIHTLGDLLTAYPYRYVDKTRFHKISELTEDSGEVQLKGVLRKVEVLGEGSKRRLVARFRDGTGVIELVWFRGIYWLERHLKVGAEHVVFGRVNSFNSLLNIPHPEIEEVTGENQEAERTFAPVYSSTDKLNAKGLDAKGRRRIMEALFEKIAHAGPDGAGQALPENLPDYMLQKLKLPARYDALRWIHFPRNQEELDAATRRLKFEELFFLQMRLLQSKYRRKQAIKGYVFSKVGDFFHQFYKEKLPFELTDAQKRVVKEIRADMGAGIQMNRLLQGDVGSGKTVVGLLCMLIALDNGYQACLMAPTEILAQQHFIGISDYVAGMGIEVAFLSGTVKGKKRQKILEDLAAGRIHILIGTHALIEDWVVFQNLGLAITDEQHRFGVAQRASLWKKSKPLPPHVLVMTATPIPRTLAMTLYGDLDVSVIDELPPGRKPITTVHRTENHRLRVFGFMKEEIEKGRQIYVVYPLIEESEKLDLKNLMEGYEALSREFPPPEYQLSIVHGKMKPADKDFEMQRFVKGETQIMVATTVIEVGVNVPNASVMIIENTERFGLSQLHQLRGRVGRGAEQSFCILMTDFKLSAEARERIQTMVSTNNGFEIAEADLRLRGPGNMEGTQQSGLLDLHIADLGRDGKILQAARELALRILEKDPELANPLNERLKAYLANPGRKVHNWGRIS
ncbi:MAG: ATP-dependent DNA helicase RecG [Lewinellaceae bacterium]|nr:ATP-dependent DNA helicase RecG [Saprospiraceae bacterium]MCB9338611.1 ATP-dependent DNA helicase RecG [Lewinellaceae bacterium]